MRDFVLLQLVCMLVPAVFAAVIWAIVAVVQPGQQRLGMRINLSTLFILFPVIGGILLVTRTIADELYASDQIVLCILSLFTIPFVWFVQLLIDGWRDARRRWAEQQAQEVMLDRMLAQQIEAQREDT